jgi:periplasmic protein TonB
MEALASGVGFRGGAWTTPIFLMADTELLPPESETLEAPARTLHAAAETPHLGTELQEESTFRSLVNSIRDTFFAPKLPPLVLESKPIYTKDPMATKMSRSSIAGSIVFYTILILLIALALRKGVQLAAPPKTTYASLDIPPPPPVAPKAETIGGGGGQKGPTPVTKGHLPKLAQEQIVPPKAPPVEPPKLAVEPTVVVQKNLQMADNKMPDLGMPSSKLNGASMGNGSGTGIGSGNGSGIGPGSGSNTGGGVMHVGGSIRPPSVLSAVEPEFSEEARKAKFSGNVQVYLIVDEQGNPSHVKVVRGVGMGLDEKAVEAVRQYKFKPATQNGKPVKVDLYIEVNFQIF